MPQSWECFAEPVGLVSLLEIMNQLDEVEGSGFRSGSMPPSHAGRGAAVCRPGWHHPGNLELAASINARDPFRLAALLTPELQARLVVDLLEG